MSCCVTDSPLLPPTEYRCVYRHHANTCCGVAHDVNYVEYFDCLLSLANKVENIDRGQVFAYPSLTPQSALSAERSESPPTRGFSGPPESTPKRHLDWFRRFSTAHVRDQQTGRQTTLQR